MFEYLNEFDDMEMDVQVGPQEEIEAEVDDAPEELTPVDIAKKDPESVAVAAVEKKDDECEECEHEFYVDGKDVAKYADLNEETMLEALNDIINVNEKYGMRADNLVVVVSESTMNYARNLEKNGCALMFVKEADKDLQNRRDVQPNNADKEALKSMNDEDLKNYYEKRKELAQHSKERRADIDSKSTFGKKSFDYGAHNRDYASDAAKEMKRRGLEVNTGALQEGDEEFEEDDIEMDVQVGPDGEEKVAEDPQEANPVDAVKREYDSVVVAKDDDEFFVDVEDVQKCADINCESVIETLNGIIAANEASGITAQNLRVIITESTDLDLVNSLKECGVILEAKFSFMPKFKREPELQKYLGDLQDAENLLSAHNIDPKVGIHKAGRIALRILSIYQNVASYLYLPMCITIIGIPVYLLVRAWAWAYDSGEEEIAKAEGKKVIAKYDALISEEKDPKKKEKLQDARDKIAKGLEKLDK